MCAHTCVYTDTHMYTQAHTMPSLGEEDQRVSPALSPHASHTGPPTHTHPGLWFLIYKMEELHFSNLTRFHSSFCQATWHVFNSWIGDWQKIPQGPFPPWKLPTSLSYAVVLLGSPVSKCRPVLKGSFPKWADRPLLTRKWPFNPFPLAMSFQVSLILAYKLSSFIVLAHSNHTACASFYQKQHHQHWREMQAGRDCWGCKENLQMAGCQVRKRP
jgi:hypothetical protein